MLESCDKVLALETESFVAPSAGSLLQQEASLQMNGEMISLGTYQQRERSSQVQW